MVNNNDWEEIPNDDWEEVSSHADDWEEVPEFSKLESGIRGGAQGLSFGFADEVEGGVGAAIRKLLGDQGSLKDIYQEERDDARKVYDEASAANPKTYLASQVGGAVGSGLLTGGSSLGALALQGAAQGLGDSRADLTEGDVLGAAKDTAIGTGIGAAGYGIGKGIQKLAPSADNIAKGVKEIAESPEIYGYAGKDATEEAIKAASPAYDTFMGKAYHGVEGLETGLKKFGNIPEEIGAGGMDTFDGLKKTIEPLLNPFESATAQYGKMAEKSGTQRVVDTLKGTGKMMGTGATIGVLGGPSGIASGAMSGLSAAGTAMGSKAAGFGVGAARQGVRKAAQLLSPETVGAIAPQMGKYGQVLMNAAQRGQQSLASTHFILQQTDPDYRTTYNNATGETDGPE